MSTYVVLGKMTDQGAKNIKDLPRLVKENRARGEQLGIKLLGWYLTEGRYDFVVLIEAPDDQAAATMALGVASGGNMRTETLRAFPLEELAQIVQKIS
jgi:uncharacterized protein with GYD domain